MLQIQQIIQGAIGTLVFAAIGVPAAFAQGNLPMAVAGDQISIKREPSRVIDPHKYRVPLSIEAIQTVTLVAPFDGKVKQIVAKTNSKQSQQSEIVRFDNDIQKLQLARAKLVLKQAEYEQKAADKDETQAALAQIKVDIAKVDLDLVQSLLDQTSLRSPFSGEVQRMLVVEGQFVRSGDPIAVIADTSKMKVEIPVDRSLADHGKPVTLKIEASEIEGKIDAILPLPPKFDVLRELFDSIASVQAVIDNSDGKFKVGQTVYVPLVPRQPVVEVPIAAIGNLPDGHRKVQVVRQMMVRDVAVSLLGQIGSNRVFVSGPFAEADEVIFESTHMLGDGFQLKQGVNPAVGTTGTGTTSGTPQPTGTSNPKF